MTLELKMPALSPTMEEGALARWLVKEGDRVSKGDVIAEIETDKAVMEFEAPEEGIFGRLIVPAGTENVKVGQAIALLLRDGETPGALDSSSRPDDDESGAVEEIPTARNSDLSLASDRQSNREAAQARIKASPLARRLAAAEGLDLAALNGSGPDGRVVRADVEAIMQGQTARTGLPSQSPLPVLSALAPTSEPDIPHDVVQLTGMRRTIARRLTEAKQTIPHIYLTVDVRLNPLLNLRADVNGDRDMNLSINDFLIRALALALIRNGACNVQFDGDRLLTFRRADIAVAVAVPGGLFTPVVAAANEKTLSAISAEMRDLADRAREGKLAPQDYQGGTASLSNLGMLGIDQFDAIINAPQAMIMAVGAAEKRPIVRNDKIEIATMLRVTGSFDHRAIDGADAAGLMATFRELLESPLQILV